MVDVECAQKYRDVQRHTCFLACMEALRHQCSKMYDGSNALKNYIHVFFQSVFYHCVFLRSEPDLLVFY